MTGKQNNTSSWTHGRHVELELSLALVYNYWFPVLTYCRTIITKKRKGKEGEERRGEERRGEERRGEERRGEERRGEERRGEERRGEERRGEERRGEERRGSGEEINNYFVLSTTKLLALFGQLYGELELTPRS